MNLENLTDIELIKLARSNDENAVTVLINRYKVFIRAISRSYFIIGAELDDLIQEGMIAIVSAINRYNGKVKFSSYVYKCIKNRIITFVNKYNNLKNKPLKDYISLSGITGWDNDKTEMSMDSVIGPEDVYINDEAIKEINEKIKSALSKFEYKILFYYLQGLSYNDISIKTGKNSKAIDNALQRIRHKLSPIFNG